MWKCEVQGLLITFRGHSHTLRRRLKRHVRTVRIGSDFQAHLRFRSVSPVLTFC